MALLTLEAEQTPCAWDVIEDKLALWPAALESVRRAEGKRTYKCTLPDHGHIALFAELQTLLGQEGVHFFIDLKS